MELDELLNEIRLYPGLKRKACISQWAGGFTGGQGAALGPGDDAGAIAVEGGYLLLSAEGIWPPLLSDPAFAGFCAVTVSVNDIYAMGGRPLGLLSVIFAGESLAAAREEFLGGVRKGLDHYRIPLVGGHTTTWKGSSLVAVAVAGFARKLLRGDKAKPGDAIVYACDLEGKAHPELFAWDTVTSERSELTLKKLEALIEIAERGLCSAAKDVSNPGLLGTLAMMLESSGAGARISLEAIPVPDGVDLAWWLKAYPSYGFLLTVPREDVGAITSVFSAAGVDWAVIGEVEVGSRICVESEEESSLFLDWRSSPVTGLSID